MVKSVLYDYFDKKADALLALSKLNSIQRSSINIGSNREMFLSKFINKRYSKYNCIKIFIASP
ncbi:MAG: hypothetical protein KAW56_05930 [Candidatus Marinimicrobia bacterium]|nr:hypothetical protein [Candidatus Neomarinimicrobiota bacterium]